ncbi:Uncharacterised protein [Vibrio cholerae]|nr:Uncharacterised protein [Vibrio cholerae]CSI19099.1 Uncharacterised protein [Vibrio cholerae]
MSGLTKPKSVSNSQRAYSVCNPLAQGRSWLWQRLHGEKQAHWIHRCCH